MKFQSKSIPVDAIQVTGTGQNVFDITQMTNGRAVVGSQRKDAFIVETDHGSKMAMPGDWIVADGHGNLEAYTNEGFVALFEPVPAPEPAKAAANHDEIADRAFRNSLLRAKEGAPADPVSDWNAAVEQLTHA